MHDDHAICADDHLCESVTHTHIYTHLESSVQVSSHFIIAKNEAESKLGVRATSEKGIKARAGPAS